MASADAELADFVKAALTRGAAREDVAAALIAAGWSQEQARGALDRYAAVDFPVPVPRPRAYLSARDAFIYLVLFSTLGASATHLGSLIFELIDMAFPDPAGSAVSFSGIRWAISVLVVSFPIYLYLSVKTAAEVAADPSKRASSVRKWLTYLTLFVAALTISGDLVALIYQFLNGELTIRVALKVATVGAIAGAVFVYYLRSMSLAETKA